MKLTREEQKNYDRCSRRFIKYGFDTRERFAKEWLRANSRKQEHERIMREFAEDEYGLARVDCPICSSPVFIDEREYQLIQTGKWRQSNCEYCTKNAKKNEIAKVAHLDSPYKNRIVENMELGYLGMVGTGERRWQKGRREANRYSYDIPDDYVFDRKNEKMVEYVNKKADSELIKLEARYNMAPDDKKQGLYWQLAEYIWILNGELSIDFHNCVRLYIGLPAITEKSYGLIMEPRRKTVLTPEQEPEIAQIEDTPHISINQPKTTSLVSKCQITPPKTLKEYFKSKGLSIVDKRTSGGCLWVIGSEDEIQKYTDEACKLFDISGAFCGGGRATKNKRSWYTKSDK